MFSDKLADPSKIEQLRRALDPELGRWVALLAAHCIDLPARRFRAVGRSLVVGAVAATLFAMLGYFALLWSQVLLPPAITIDSRTDLALVMMAPVGAIIGIAVSLAPGRRWRARRRRHHQLLPGEQGRLRPGMPQPLRKALGDSDTTLVVMEPGESRVFRR